MFVIIAYAVHQYVHYISIGLIQQLHTTSLCVLHLLCVSCRNEDEWSTLAVNCLEQFSSGTDVLNVVPLCSSNRLSSMDKVHTFQHLADRCSQLAASYGPLWPEHYSALLVELYRLLVTKDSEVLLYAIQLSIILLPRNTRSHLRHLLLFMRCAADPTQVSLSTKASTHYSVLCCTALT